MKTEIMKLKSVPLVETNMMMVNGSLKMNGFHMTNTRRLTKKILGKMVEDFIKKKNHRPRTNSSSS